MLVSCWGWLAILLNESSLSSHWIDTAKCWCVVGQRKMSCAAAGKKNMSKVSPRLGYWEYVKSGIWHMTMNDSIVIMTLNSQRWIPGSIPPDSQIYSLLLPRTWHEETMARGIMGLCAGDISWLLQKKGKLRVYEQWSWCMLADC